MLGRELLANEGADARQVQGRHRFRHARSDAVVAPQRVAVADDQEFTVHSLLGGTFH
ncbi:MAG: hypothetical protein V9H26_27315 [Verrucomicrobiota bacterium]